MTRYEQDGSEATAMTVVDRPEGLSFDASGNLYFNTRSPGHTGVWKIPEADPAAAPVNVISPFATIGEGTAFAQNQDLLAAAANQGKIVRSPAPGYGEATDFITGLVKPIGLAVDSFGDIYVANWDPASFGNSTIEKYSDDGTFIEMITDGLDSPRFIELDELGNIYVANEGSGEVVKVSPGGTKTTIATIPGSIGLALCKPTPTQEISVLVEVPNELTLNDDGWYAENAFELRVRVTSNSGVAFSGSLEVTFSDSSRLILGDDNGFEEHPTDLSYEISLAPGESDSKTWSVWAQPMSKQTLTFTGSVFNSSNELAGQGNEQMFVPTANIHPVVVVPGLMGSMKDSSGKWLIDPLKDTYQNLLEELELAGYEPDISLFTFPYDWRQHIAASGNELGDAVTYDMLPKASGRSYINDSSVDLVGHSLGGLVSRAYVQSNAYTGNVYKLITLGTPHLGAPKAYLAAEGLEFDLLDEYLGKNGKFFAEKLLRAFAWKNDYCTDIGRICFTTKADLHDYIESEVPSIREVFPVDEYIRNDPGGYLISADDPSLIFPFWHHFNGYLTSLNDDIDTLINRLGTDKVISVVGKRPNEDTHRYYLVVKPNFLSNLQGLWTNGEVKSGNEFRETGPGDVTVPTESANMSLIKASLIPEIRTKGDDDSNDIVIEHGKMPSQLQLSTVELLTSRRPFFDAGFIDPRFNWDNALLLRNLSPVEIQVIDPANRKVGWDFVLEKGIAEIPGAIFSRSTESNEPDFVIIPDPLEGEYVIRLFGIDDGKYRALMTSLTEEGSLTFAEFTGTTFPGKIHEHSVVFDQNTIPIAPLRLEWLPPLNDPGEKPLEVTSTSTLPIKFSIHDAQGSFVEDDNILVWVVDAEDQSSAVAVFSTTNVNLHDKSDTIRSDPEGEQYIVNLHMREYNLHPGRNYIVGVSRFESELETTAISVKGN